MGQMSILDYLQQAVKYWLTDRLYHRCRQILLLLLLLLHKTHHQHLHHRLEWLAVLSDFLMLELKLVRVEQHHPLHQRPIDLSMLL